MYKLPIYQSMLSILISNHWQDAGCKPVKKMLHMWCFFSLATWDLVKTKKDITHFIFNSQSVLKYLKVCQDPFWCFYYIALTLHEQYSIWNHQDLGCSFNSLFNLNKTSNKEHIIGPLWLNQVVTNRFLSQGQVMWIAGSSWVVAIQDPT